MAGQPVDFQSETIKYRYRVQDILILHLYTIPRTPFYLSFLALIYVMFLLFMARQETGVPPFIAALPPTLGCAVIGVAGPAFTALFSDKVKSERVIETSEGGIHVTVADQLTVVHWAQINRILHFWRWTFLKLKNGSYLMVPDLYWSEKIEGAILSGTKKPA
ncbi:MAG: hypothetical protein JJ934_09680 [Pseudomonadales bacterium]|nr:hypothetical protein [Pseudomonadales bacterium]